MSLDCNQLVYSAVEQWIGSLSGDLKNDPYEMNEFTISYLHRLSQLNENTDRHLEHKTIDNLEKSEEYSAESERIIKKFMLLGIEEKDLEQKSVDSLSKTADIGNCLSVTLPTHENYLLNLSDYSMDELHLKELLKRQEKLLQNISDMLENLNLNIAKLSEEVDASANSRETDKLDVPVEIEKAKAQAQHYVESTKEFKKLLSASGVKKEYTHEALLTLSNKVTILSAEIQTIEEKVAQFKQLPPSMPLAQEKIRQVKEEIETVEKSFPELSLCN